LARTFREKLTGSRILEYADLAPVLASARAELREASLVVKPDHWQTQITEELLDMVQAGQTDEARKMLMDGLMEGASPVAAS
ncbi:MAG: hypothetical protein QF717_15155, partial [SAR202 cluster bacterium]|nr:hypothetical protein [SAR202 cluster bacterium]